MISAHRQNCSKLFQTQPSNQVASTSISTLFPHTTTTAVHPPTASSALGNAHFWANWGRVIVFALYPPLSYFLRSPLCHISSSTASNHGDDKLGGSMREMKRRGKKGRRAGMRQCVFHTLPRLFSFYFSSSSSTMRRATHMPRRLSLFFSLSFDDTVCNPHAVSSVSFFPLSFDDAACNPHAALSVPFFSLLFDNAACNPCTVSSVPFFPLLRRCGVQPTCRVVRSFLFPSRSMMPCATHILRH